MCWFLVCMDCRYKCYTGTICNNDAPPFCLSILGQLDVNSRWRTLLLTDTHQARIILLIPLNMCWILFHLAQQLLYVSLYISHHPANEYNSNLFLFLLFLLESLNWWINMILIQKLTKNLNPLSAEGVENGTSETCQNLCTGKKV